jgi:hypothetical protein
MYAREMMGRGVVGGDGDGKGIGGSSGRYMYIV